MRKTDKEFNALMQEVLAGSDTAAAEFFRDYQPYLLHAIRRRLNKKLRPRFDSRDFAQDVWASFFAQDPRERVFQTPDDLVSYLTRLAQNKVVDRTRQQFDAEKRNVNREESMDDSKVFNKELLRAKQPSPSQIVMSQDEWRAFLSKQPLVYRQIYVLLREGRTPVEIAEELAINPRTVQRVVERFRGLDS